MKKSARRSTTKNHCMPQKARRLQPEQRAPAYNCTAKPCPFTKSARRSTTKHHCMPQKARRLQPEQRAPANKSTRKGVDEKTSTL